MFAESVTAKIWKVASERLQDGVSHATYIVAVSK